MPFLGGYVSSPIGYINPYYWVDEFIPYYMEINGSLDIEPGLHKTKISRKIPTDSWNIPRTLNTPVYEGNDFFHGVCSRGLLEFPYNTG